MSNVDFSVDRAEKIILEISKSHPAHYTDGGATIAAVYLQSESIGVIACQAIAMRLTIQKLESEVERLRELTQEQVE